MNKNAKIADILPKDFFWDMKIERLDVERDITLIIPRALYFTTPITFNADISRLEKIYNKREIIHYLKATREPLDNKVLALVASRYHVTPFQRFALS